MRKYPVYKRYEWQQQYAEGYILGCMVREAKQPYAIQWMGRYYIRGYYDGLKDTINASIAVPVGQLRGL